MSQRTDDFAGFRWLVAAMRDGAWLHAERVIAYGRVLLLVTLVIAAYRLFAVPNIVPDFPSFWTASLLALHGSAATVYDPVAFCMAQETIPGTSYLACADFFYPPIYLLICLPLALLPFAWSAAAWLATTCALFFAALRGLLPKQPSTMYLAAAFPAMWLNAGSGQNGFLTAALFGFAARWFDRRPILAGVCLGGLAFKPQFGLVLPGALIASGRWRTTVSATATVAALAGFSFLAFGDAPWLGFVHGLPVGTDLSPQVGISWFPPITVMGTAELLHLPASLGIVAQIIVTVGACIATAMLARRCRDSIALGVVLSVGAVVASPWLHTYDLTILALPIAWLVVEGLRFGFLPWEKLMVFIAYVLPLIEAPLTIDLHVQISPAVLTLLFAAVWRRVAYFRPAYEARRSDFVLEPSGSPVV